MFWFDTVILIFCNSLLLLSIPDSVLEAVPFTVFDFFVCIFLLFLFTWEGLLSIDVAFKLRSVFRLNRNAGPIPCGRAAMDILIKVLLRRVIS